MKLSIHMYTQIYTVELVIFESILLDKNISHKVGRGGCEPGTEIEDH